MRLSRYFLPTLKNDPAEAQIVSHRLMLRAGMIRQEAAGIYAWLPLGLRVLRNVERIVREEMDRAGAVELLMPTLQLADLWRESGRYDAYGPEMLRITDRHERELLYGPTNEEMVTDIFRSHVSSWCSLPLNLYQVQWKFRDEQRPRFGLMRGREFLMKDAYSFDLDEAGAQRSYQRMFVAYLRMFARMGLKAIPMRAETGPIGGDLSHEFIVLAQTGESAVYCDRGVLDLPVPASDVDYAGDLQPVIDQWTRLYAATEDVHDPARFERDVAPTHCLQTRGIEVGQIFYFGTKYSLPMKATVTGVDGVARPIHGGCYGVGISRLIGAIIEASHDDQGIVWPAAVAPFDVGLVNLKSGDKRSDDACETLYAQLRAAGLSVLYDDTDDRAGAKFSKMDLIGLPWQLIVGPRGFDAGVVELKHRATGERQVLSPEAAVPWVIAAQAKQAGNIRVKKRMTDLLWQKAGVTTNARIMAFLAGDDVVLDREFFLHDITASKSHVEGLANIKVVTADEAAALKRELDALVDDFRSGAFVLDDRYEDGHSAIEARLTERLGDAGRRVHTGRSRNDQILVATRLWLKEQLATLQSHCRAIAQVCLDRAAQPAIPLPGYTHLQRAVVSSTGMWFAGFAEGFIDNALRAKQTSIWIDANPLGTAAGYGVNLKLDREHTTQALGFARMQVSPIYAQLSRGKFEMAVLEAIASALLDLRRLAWDLSLFTTAEFNFVSLPSEYTTGSSIMPNKRNPDVVELLRASYASVAAARTEIEQLLSLPSGYQRDLQLSKGSLFHGCRHGLMALALVPDLLARLQWNEAPMRAAIEPAMYATDVAIEQAAAGVPFRDAYRAAAKAAANAGEGRTPESSLAARTSPGAGHDLRLDELAARLAQLDA